MKIVLQILSYTALAALILAALLYMGGTLSKPAMKAWMLVATLVWFGTAPLWMGKRADGA
jgi:hypothetical protein